MKRLLLAVALLTVTLSICVAGWWTLRWQTGQWLSLLDDTEAAFRAGDLKTAAATAEVLSTAISEQNRWLPLFLTHEPVDKVEESAALLPALIKSDRGSTVEELARCRLLLKQLGEFEDIGLGNVL